MLTFSLFLIGAARHPGQRFLQYDGAWLQTAPASPRRITALSPWPPLPAPTRALMSHGHGVLQLNAKSCLLGAGSLAL